ncbi:hypothetical protein [Streptomyces sp. NPDC057617]|uniref:hypothetical protein n=1 Tax=Streptomyces sp. NPDC057617 TaxID=3346184 RepID=UPI0036798554
MLEREPAKGPVARGRPDQTWTLSRIRTLFGRRFHKSYTEQGVAALIRTVRQQLGRPIVLVWGNLNTYITAGMRRYIADHDWLTVIQWRALPSRPGSLGCS